LQTIPRTRADYLVQPLNFTNILKSETTPKIDVWDSLHSMNSMKYHPEQLSVLADRQPVSAGPGIIDRAFLNHCHRPPVLRNGPGIRDKSHLNLCHGPDESNSVATSPTKSLSTTSRTSEWESPSRTIPPSCRGRKSRTVTVPTIKADGDGILEGSVLSAIFSVESDLNYSESDCGLSVCDTPFGECSGRSRKIRMDDGVSATTTTSATTTSTTTTRKNGEDQGHEDIPNGQGGSSHLTVFGFENDSAVDMNQGALTKSFQDNVSTRQNMIHGKSKPRVAIAPQKIHETGISNPSIGRNRCHNKGQDDNITASTLKMSNTDARLQANPDDIVQDNAYLAGDASASKQSSNISTRARPPIELQKPLNTVAINRPSRRRLVSNESQQSSSHGRSDNDGIPSPSTPILAQKRSVMLEVITRGVEMEDSMSSIHVVIPKLILSSVDMSHRRRKYNSSSKAREDSHRAEIFPAVHTSVEVQGGTSPLRDKTTISQPTRRSLSRTKSPCVVTTRSTSRSRTSASPSGRHRHHQKERSQSSRQICASKTDKERNFSDRKLSLPPTLLTVPSPPPPPPYELPPSPSHRNNMMTYSPRSSHKVQSKSPVLRSKKYVMELKSTPPASKKILTSKPHPSMASYQSPRSTASPSRRSHSAHRRVDYISNGKHGSPPRQEGKGCINSTVVLTTADLKSMAKLNIITDKREASHSTSEYEHIASVLNQKRHEREIHCRARSQSPSVVSNRFIDVIVGDVSPTVPKRSFSVLLPDNIKRKSDDSKMRSPRLHHKPPASSSSSNTDRRALSLSGLPSSPGRETLNPARLPHSSPSCNGKSSRLIKPTGHHGRRREDSDVSSPATAPQRRSLSEPRTHRMRRAHSRGRSFRCERSAMNEVATVMGEADIKDHSSLDHCRSYDPTVVSTPRSDQVPPKRHHRESKLSIVNTISSPGAFSASPKDTIGGTESTSGSRSAGALRRTRPLQYGVDISSRSPRKHPGRPVTVSGTASPSRCCNISNSPPPLIPCLPPDAHPLKRRPSIVRPADTTVGKHHQEQQ
jgi:hypothetical protein